MRRHGALGFALVSLVASPALAQVPAGPEFRVNSYTTFSQYLPSIAAEPDGDFVVVWTSWVQDGQADGVFGQRFAADGSVRGAEFQISTYTLSRQTLPQVAVRPNGEFVVVWYHQGHDYEIIVYGRRFDAAGRPRGAEFRVNQQTGGWPVRPRSVYDGQGRFLVVWTGGNDGNLAGTMARLFDQSGAPVAGEFRVNTSTLGEQALPDPAALRGGGFVVVWEEKFSPNGSGLIFGQRLAANGSFVGAEFQIDDLSTSGHWGYWPSVSAGADGGFVVVWTDFSTDDIYGVRARRFAADGTPIGSSFVVHEPTYGNGYVHPHAIAHDEAGRFVVTWAAYTYNEDRWSIFGQRYDGAGNRRGPEFRVDTFTTGHQMWGVVASDAVGNFVVAWDGPLHQEVNGQRFGGLLPAALRVDTLDNGVFEPKESRDVRPSWRNVNGAAQTFGASALSFSGPPATGVEYQLTDASATYGTVANDTAAECVDCYHVGITFAGERPALHWDATLDELIAPDALGQRKQWALHIGGSFSDVPRSSPFYRFVETLLHRSVTAGCAGTTYCPLGSTTREQMSVFLLVAKDGAGYLPSACATPVFADVPASSPFCRWIEELARRGVTGGCGGGNYCPAAAVTREQMAVFVLRTLDPLLDPPACTTPVFADVPASSPFCRWIEELARRGVVGGCAPGLYCPPDPVTREQMAVFLTGTFGLTLYGV